ncbi:MAG: hypothetical protein ABIJ91_04680 [Candidatus Kuenenbacteria bacterium]
MANSKQFFRIEGEAVHLVQETIQRTVKLSDLMGEVVKEMGVTTPILPAGCRFFAQKSNMTTFVIEQAPATRKIIWYNMGNDEKKWKIAFPYVIFILKFSGDAISEVRIFYRNKPLNGDDLLLSTNMGNTRLSGHLCTGDIRVQGETKAQKAESFVAGFWNSAWNTDIQESWHAHTTIEQVSSLQKWEEESEKNPFFPLSVKWREYAKLNDVVEGRK